MANWDQYSNDNLMGVDVTLIDKIFVDDLLFTYKFSHDPRVLNWKMK